jgi:hypothetical protein
VAKVTKKVRGKFADEKYLGPEPDLREDSTNVDIIKAYNWYNYFYDSESAKEFVIAYLKEFHKTEKDLIKNVGRIDSSLTRTIGWNCRILTLGGYLPDEVVDRTLKKIRELAKDAKPEPVALVDDQPVKEVISIQERIKNKAGEIIGEIEGEIDTFITEKENNFRISDFLRHHDVKPQIAQRIADYYKPLYAELFDAMQGKDEQLVEAYASWKKPKLKAYCEFVRNIVAEAETRAIVIKANRKPRKKKEKPAGVQVSKMKYLEKSEEFGFVSVKATEIIGANQLWVFNTKYRNLSVYNAMGPAGLAVKGTTITGYDEKTSITKKLRKPTEQVNKLLAGGKIVMRKFMDEIKCKPKMANGRINMETILLRVNK